MALDPVTAIGNVVNTVIERIFPDKTQQELGKLELAKMQLSGELAAAASEVQLSLAQIDVNKAEADNPNVFVSGWRPFIGWVCGFTFAYSFLVGPAITQISAAYGYSFPLPVIDMNNMIYILGGMLGLGGLRTFEKVKGVATK